MTENLKKPSGIILNPETIRTQTQVAQTPAEKEYFRSLSNRLFIDSVAYIGGGPIVATILANITIHNFDPMGPIASGLGAGFALTAERIWSLRNERFPKPKGTDSGTHQS